MTEGPADPVHLALFPWRFRRALRGRHPGRRRRRDPVAMRRRAVLHRPRRGHRCRGAASASAHRRDPRPGHQARRAAAPGRPGRHPHFRARCRRRRRRAGPGPEGPMCHGSWLTPSRSRGMPGRELVCVRARACARTGWHIADTSVPQGRWRDSGSPGLIWTAVEPRWR